MSDITPLGDDLVDGLRKACAKLGRTPDAVIEEAEVAYWFRESVDRHLDKHKPHTVMTGMNHDKKYRLFEVRARKRGIPSVYVPHAPTGLSRLYAELTADLVLLRGQRDFDYYAWCGANPKQMRVVGDPMLELGSREPRSEAPIVVIATSADRSARELRRFFELLETARVSELAEIVVTPHPRGRAAAELLAPRFNFGLFPGRTSDALTQLNVIAMVSERSSGTMLEAEALGIPTVAASPHPNYVFECDLGTKRVSDDAEELRGALEVVTAEDGGERRERELAASAWVDQYGSHARARIADELADGVGAMGPALDNWGVFGRNSGSGTCQAS